MSRILLYCLFSCFTSVVLSAASSEFTFNDNGHDYQYSVVPTGDNYTFKFLNKFIDDPVVKIKAGRDVLLSVYQDDSIQKRYTEAYIKERARCYVFDSRFYTYSLCLLPNDFDPKSQDRFWGFVTQVPNWKWLLTRFLLPAVFAFALFFYMGNRSRQ
ncbi:MAG: hypothetical protein GQ582_04625 [Methyloprofundus sp.]|nr:hypothetical protein [Methyloprofundus sp.]